MRALDTSVVVPALVAWHEAHASVVARVEQDDRLPQHVALETYSVLTRLPAPLRLDPGQAADSLRARFPPPYLALSAEEHDALVLRMGRVRVLGGAVYDGLIGLTASAHGRLLLTRDHRAATTYQVLGVEHERLA